MVSDILTPSGNWNDELIKQIFVEIDTNAILRTSIRGAGDDSWAREPETHGIYSVKSAYRRRAYEERWQQGDKELASSSRDLTWKRIWRLCPSEGACLLVACGE